MKELSSESKLRYARQIAIREIGLEGQKRICSAKVLIIGCGALGSMIAMQLAGAGVGHIGIADYDTIDLSNLQRQIFFSTEESGEPKVYSLSSRIKKLNPTIEVKVYNCLITSQKAEEIFPAYDFIIDGTDNPDSKRTTGTVALKKNKPCCIGGVKDFGGQIMTFLPGEPRFEDYFGIISDGGILPCSLSGVLGSAAAVCASIQATEAIKWITNSGDLLNGRLLRFDLLKDYFQIFTL